MAVPALILASHGFFAQEALRSAEMIIAHEQANVGVISVTPGKDYDTCLEEIHELYDELDTKDGCLILTDIYGGTPANVATYLAIEHSNICVFSGLNIPLLLEVLLDGYSDLNGLETKIESIHKDTLVNVSKKLKGANNNGNQMGSY